jgi:hypothetical protein
MNPDEIYVVINKVSLELYSVWAELVMAQRNADKLISTKLSGTIPNKEKILVVTLSRYLDEIQIRHLEEITDNKEVQEVQGRWGICE